MRKKAPLWLIVLLLGWGGVPADPGRACANSSPGGWEGDPHLRITKKGVAIPIPDCELLFAVGDRLALIQRNANFFIVASPSSFPGQRVCALKRFHRASQPTGWITGNQELVIGYPTRSCEGILQLHPGSELPIVEESGSAFHVLFPARPHAMRVEVPRETAGWQIINRERDPSLFALQPEKPATEPNPPAEPDPTPRPQPVATAASGYLLPNVEAPSIKTRPGHRPTSNTDVTAEDVSISFYFGPPAGSDQPAEAAGAAPIEISDQAAAPAAEQPQVEWVSGTLHPRTPTYKPAPPPEQAALTVAPTTGWIGQTYRLLVHLRSAAAVVFFFVIVWMLYKSHQRRYGRTGAPSRRAASDSDADARPDKAAPMVIPDFARGREECFSGNLGMVALSDVLLYLNSSKDTGMLTITRASDATPFYLEFQHGEIFNAISPNNLGMETLREVFPCREGSFAFERQPPLTVDNQIGRSVKALLNGQIEELHPKAAAQAADVAPPQPARKPVAPVAEPAAAVPASVDMAASPVPAPEPAASPRPLGKLMLRRMSTDG